MKRFGLLLVLALAACAPPAPATNHRVGADFSPVAYWLPAVPAVTGNSATITVWDSTVGYNNNSVERVMFSGFYNQVVTVLYRTKNTGSSTWRTVNGSGSGDATTANTLFTADYFLQGPNSQIQVVTGGTGPTTSETSVGLVYERTKGL